MHIEKYADLRLSIVFWFAALGGMAIAIFLVIDTYNQVITHHGTADAYWYDPKTVVMAVVAIALLATAYATTSRSRYKVLVELRELIDKLYGAFNDCDVDDTPMVFAAIDNIAVSVKKTDSGAYLITVRTLLGVQREIYMRRYSVQDALTGEVLPLTEMSYFRALVRFVYGHLDFADEVDDVNYAPMEMELKHRP